MSFRWRRYLFYCNIIWPYFNVIWRFVMKEDDNVFSSDQNRTESLDPGSDI